MNILCDVDGCICQYDFTHLLAQRFGVAIPNEQIYTHDLVEALGITNSESNSIFDEAVHEHPYFIYGAQATLGRLKQAGHVVWIWTGRLKYMTIQGLEAWLDRYEVPYNYAVLDGNERKYDVHIDDAIPKLMGSSAPIKLLFDQPWNRMCHNVRGALTRVYSWAEIEEIINGQRTLP